MLSRQRGGGHGQKMVPSFVCGSQSDHHLRAQQGHSLSLQAPPALHGKLIPSVRVRGSDRLAAHPTSPAPRVVQHHISEPPGANSTASPTHRERRATTRVPDTACPLLKHLRPLRIPERGGNGAGDNEFVPPANREDTLLANGAKFEPFTLTGKA